MAKVRIVAFTPAHFRQMRVQPRQRAQRDATPQEVIEKLGDLHSYTVLADDEVLACFGMAPIWPGRGICWAYLAEHVGTRMTAVVRAMRQAIELHQPARLEMDTEVDFAEGHRLARLLGFRKEVERVERYYPDGAAASLYARIKP